MSIEGLMSVVQPPSQPREGGKGRNWQEVEGSLGIALPSDYKEFVNVYGTGELGGLLWVYNPYADSKDQNLLVRGEEVLNIWRSRRAEYGEEECPYPLYPEANGLLPWGHADTGAELFWQTSESPQEWTVVVADGRDPEFEEFDDSMTGFLTKLMRGKIRSDIVPTPPKKYRSDFLRLGDTG